MHVEQIATISIAVAAFITAIKVITGWAPVRWVWHKLIVDPVTSAMDTTVDNRIQPYLAENQRQMQEILAEVRPNGGGSMKDQVSETGHKVAMLGAQVKGMGDRLERVESMVVTTRDAVTAAD